MKREQIPLNKNAIILPLQFKEISIRPEFSSPPRFRIVTEEQTDKGGRKLLCLILDTSLPGPCKGLIAVL